MIGLEELTAQGDGHYYSSQCGQASHALFLPPAPASGTLILIHKEPYCGERGKKKKMTTVNPAKVAGLSRNIATL